MIRNDMDLQSNIDILLNYLDKNDTISEESAAFQVVKAIKEMNYSAILEELDND